MQLQAGTYLWKYVTYSILLTLSHLPRMINVLGVAWFGTWGFKAGEGHCNVTSLSSCFSHLHSPVLPLFLLFHACHFSIFLFYLFFGIVKKVISFFFSL